MMPHDVSSGFPVDLLFVTFQFKQFNMDGAVSLLISAAIDLKARADQAKFNKELCGRLADRALMFARATKDKDPSGPGFALTIENLRTAVNAGLDLVVKFTVLDGKWFSRIFKANQVSQQFEDLHRRIDRCSSDLLVRPFIATEHATYFFW